MIFVTGGTGLVGSHMLYRLSAHDEPIRALKRAHSDLQFVKHLFSHYSDDFEERFNKIEWIEGDLLDYPTIDSALKGVDKIYHCGAMVSFAKNNKDEIIQGNVEGTANLVNAALFNSVKKICHVSSTSAVGKPLINNISTEEDILEPGKNTSNYSLSKHESEREIWRAQEEGVDVVIVNPSVILGPGKWGASSLSLFKNIWEGLKYYSKGGTAFVDVRDVAMIMEQLMNSDIKGERYLVTSENLSYFEVFTMIANHFNRPAPETEATKFMAELAWRLDGIKSFILRKEPRITKEIARTAMKNRNFSHKKVKHQLQVEFIPIEQSIKHACDYFLATTLRK